MRAILFLLQRSLGPCTNYACSYAGGRGGFQNEFRCVQGGRGVQPLSTHPYSINTFSISPKLSQKLNQLMNQLKSKHA